MQPDPSHAPSDDPVTMAAIPTSTAPPAGEQLGDSDDTERLPWEGGPDEPNDHVRALVEANTHDQHSVRL